MEGRNKELEAELSMLKETASEAEKMFQKEIAGMETVLREHRATREEDNARPKRETGEPASAEQVLEEVAIHRRRHVESLTVCEATWEEMMTIRGALTGHETALSLLESEMGDWKRVVAEMESGESFDPAKSSAGPRSGSSCSGLAFVQFELARMERDLREVNEKAQLMQSAMLKRKLRCEELEDLLVDREAKICMMEEASEAAIEDHVENHMRMASQLCEAESLLVEYRGGEMQENPYAAAEEESKSPAEAFNDSFKRSRPGSKLEGLDREGQVSNSQEVTVPAHIQARDARKERLYTLNAKSVATASPGEEAARDGDAATEIQNSDEPVLDPSVATAEDKPVWKSEKRHQAAEQRYLGQKSKSSIRSERALERLVTREAPTLPAISSVQGTSGKFSPGRTMSPMRAERLAQRGVRRVSAGATVARSRKLVADLHKEPAASAVGEESDAGRDVPLNVNDLNFATEASGGGRSARSTRSVSSSRASTPRIQMMEGIQDTIKARAARATEPSNEKPALREEKSSTRQDRALARQDEKAALSGEKANRFAGGLRGKLGTMKAARGISSVGKAEGGDVAGKGKVGVGNYLHKPPLVPKLNLAKQL